MVAGEYVKELNLIFVVSSGWLPQKASDGWNVL